MLANLFMHVLVAGVFLEGFLRDPIEGERGDRAFEAWRGDTPFAEWAAPAGELLILDPDHALLHTVTFLALGFPRTAKERPALSMGVNSFPGKENLS